jgi:hypothetical protein
MLKAAVTIQAALRAFLSRRIYEAELAAKLGTTSLARGF